MDWNFRFGRSWLMNGAATGLALVMLASLPAHAQDAATATDADAAAAQQADEDEDARLGTVRVRGIRGSLENSINLKKNSDLIAEAVSAEDIGKLPDVSIAESLARLPGLAVQRIDGRGQQLSIRGLGPDFNSAVLNGREQVTTGDNRGVEFDQFPSELLSTVVVYKTPDASLIGQGLMGTVDLRTIRPLQQNERVIAGGARYEWNSEGALNAGTDDSGYRVNGLYVDQFANNTIGVAIGFATMSTPTQANIFNSWGYPETGMGELVIGGAKPYAKSNDLDRTGVIGTFEFQPVDTFRTSVDIFYSDFEETQVLRGIELPLFWSSAQLQPGYTVEDGLVTSGTYTDVKGVVRNDLNRRSAELFSVGWNLEYDLTDDWTLMADLSASQVDREDVLLETNSGTGPNGEGATDTLGFMQSGDGYFVFNPSLDYSDTNLILLTSPQGWGADASAGRPYGQAGYLNEPNIEDDLYALRLEARRTFYNSPFSKLTFGVNATSREKVKTVDEFFVAVANGAATAPIPESAIVGTTSFDFVGLGAIVSYDPLAVLNSSALVTSRNVDDDVITKAWSVKEDVITAYVKLDVDTEFLDIPVTGNIGVQVVNTDQSSSGGTIEEDTADGAFATVSGGDEYTEVLPSLNLSFEVGENTYLRFGLARTLARARMDDLRASSTLGRNAAQIDNPNPTPDATYWSASGGNPMLRPYLANGVDISFERYFGGAGYVSIAGFYKELDNWAFDGVAPFDFSGAVSLLSDEERAELATTEGFVFAKENLEGGYIRGLEFATSIPFDMFHPSLEGFGFYFSASTTDSEIQPDPALPAISVPGLSEVVMNGSFYYENYGFSARISNRYRSEFLGEVPGFGFDRTLRFVEEESVWDAQIGFDFTDSSIDGTTLDGLSVLLQAYNLTNEPFGTFNNGDNRQVVDYQEYGTTYLLGLAYKF